MKQFFKHYLIFQIVAIIWSIIFYLIQEVSVLEMLYMHLLLSAVGLIAFFIAYAVYHLKIVKRENCYSIEIVANDDSYHEHNELIIFYWGWQFDISFEICGYFDNRPRINLDIIFFSLTLILPFRNKWTDECDAPKWGISIHNNTLWIYKGGKGNMNGGNKWWTWSIPFFTKSWVRTSILLKDDTWEHETVGKKKSFYEDHWKEKQMSWKYDYTDKYDGEVIPTTIYVDEREWRPKWLTWTKAFSIVRRTIDVHFSKEVGKQKGSWKGGCMGCGYELMPNEHPLDCLKRMERDLTF